MYDNIVLEGGGILGLAYCGAIKRLEELGVMSKIKRYAGTSIGALFCSLLVIGMKADEISTIYDKINLDGLQEPWLVSSLYKIYKYYGVFNIYSMKEELEKFISSKVNPNITLGELYSKNGKDLVIVITNYTRMQPVYLHHAQYPNIKLIDALMMSMALPFVFRPIMYKLKGKTSELYVDGGVTDNYPIHIFNNIDALYNGKIDEIKSDYVVSKTLGLKLMTPDQTNTKRLFIGINSSSTIFSYAIGLINTLRTQIERNSISIENTIPINTGDVNFIDFSLDKFTVTKLYDKGKKSVTENYA